MGLVVPEITSITEALNNHIFFLKALVCRWELERRLSWPLLQLFPTILT
jgi:hypothetical protein